MEPVGLVVGIAGLGGLFNTCLEAVERVQSYKDLRDDSQALDAQFNAEKLRFEKWGPAVGLDPEKSLADHHHALDDPDTFSAVQGASSSKGNWPAGLRQILDRLEEKIKAETRRELHAWLLGRYSPNDLYDDVTQKRLDGTCEWMLHRPTFLHWLSPAFPAKTAKLLWISGPAGFGKTILCAPVIEHLQSVLPKPVAHFFFSSDFESRGDPYVAVRSWISQVVSQDADAFDLCNEAEIRNALTDTTSLEFVEYKVSPEDVRADTASYSRSIVDRKLPNKDEATRSDISRRMADRCKGQFLWLKMQEDYLRKENKKQLEDAIARTPPGLERLYDRTSALRPLTVCEIAEAVLVHEDHDYLPIDELPDSVDQAYIDSEILGLCGPFLKVRCNPTDPSPELGTIHLAHFSVKQYLLCNITARGDLLANESLRASNEAIKSTVLAKLCLRYINFRRVWQGAPEDRRVADDAATSNLVNALFGISSPNWDFWRRYFDEHDEGLVKDKAADEASQPNPLYYASRLGLTVIAKYLPTEPPFNGNVEVVKLLLKKGADITVATNEGWTPMHAASLNGHLKVLKLLLEKGADDKVTNKFRWTPLYAASCTGRIEVVKLLLETGANVTIADNNGWTPAYAAAYRGYAEVINLFLERGADVTIADNNGWTALHIASSNGHVE
ncbi:hypothetical protein DL770_000418 [Monosporascus sp. CRB-9-2]|nr:hypothetical protein DL770_000418 [Monosporascus sp. CRB-9-2]